MQRNKPVSSEKIAARKAARNRNDRKRYWRMVEDPMNPGTKIPYGLLKKRKQNAKIVMDPTTGHLIPKKELVQTTRNKNLIIDPTTGETITKNALYLRQYAQETVMDPESGEMITRGELVKRNKKKGKKELKYWEYVDGVKTPRADSMQKAANDTDFNTQVDNGNLSSFVENK